MSEKFNDTDLTLLAFFSSRDFIEETREKMFKMISRAVNNELTMIEGVVMTTIFDYGKTKVCELMDLCDQERGSDLCSD